MANKDNLTEENLELENKNVPEQESNLPSENLDSATNPLTANEPDYKDKYTRLLAEYTNFSKQKETELSSMAKFANKNLITKILDIIDDIEAGLIQETVSEETKSILEILKLKTLQILALEGVLEIELKIGDDFNSFQCEVVQAIDDKENSGKIVQVLRKGYTLSDRVLRTAKVIVGK